MYYPCRRSKFGSQYPFVGLCLSITPVSENQIPGGTFLCSMGNRHTCSAQTHQHPSHIHTE